MTPPSQTHEKDLVGTQVVDFEQRVDIKRLRQDRLQRLQSEMAAADLEALLLFDPVNIRYAIGSRLNETFGLRFKGAHALIPQEGRPVLFDSNELHAHLFSQDAEVMPAVGVEFWMTGDYTRDNTLRWAQVLRDALNSLGISSSRLGIDRLDAFTINALLDREFSLADGLEPLSRARSIKTPDEISLIRQSCAIADVGLAKVKEAIKPGVTENDLFALLLHYNVSRGGERIDGKLLTAGGNTNPWIKRDASDRLVMPGNLVAIDTDMAGPLGYFADISRTYLCGDVQPNEEQMDAYKRAYDYIYSTIPYFVPGASFAEVAEKAPTIPPEYNRNRYPPMAHGAGMSDGWPAIYFKDPRPDEPSNYSGEIKENMVICMEASFGREHGREQVKLEEQLLIKADGPVVISQAPFDWRFMD